MTDRIMSERINIMFNLYQNNRNVLTRMRKMIFVDRYIAGISLRMKENKCNTILYLVNMIKKT